MKALGKLSVYFIILLHVNMAKAEVPAHITSFADIIEPLMPSVVNIYTVKYNTSQDTHEASLPEMLPLDKFDHFFEQYNIPFSFDGVYKNTNTLSLGSGFIVGHEGYIITNDHVVSGSDEIYVKLSSNLEVPAKIIGTDPKTDIALLKININKELPAVKFADSSKVRVGDVVIAIGNPLGFGGTVTTGIISSKGRDLGLNQDELVDDFLQTDAAINTGSSGGPLYDINGEVIGINTSVPDINNGTNIGIGFAIPSNTVIDIMKQLKEKGEIKRGRLDVSVQEVSKDLAEALSLDETKGVLVVSIKPGGVGEKAGLKRSDLITHFNNQEVLNPRKLQIFMSDSNIGDEVKLSIIRDNESIDLTAIINEYIPPQTEYTKPKEIETITRSGVVFSNSASQDGGIKVLSTDTNIESLNLAVGDLISAVNQQPIKNIQEFNKIYEELSKTEKKSVVLLVKRGDITMFTALPIK